MGFKFIITMYKKKLCMMTSHRSCLLNYPFLRLRVHPYTDVTQCNNLLERYKCIIHDGEKNDLC